MGRLKRLLAALWQRIKFGATLVRAVRKRAVVWIAAVASGLGLLQVVRGELPEQDQKWLLLREWLPHLSWRTWVILGLIAVIVLVLETAYRLSVSSDEIDYDPEAPKRYTPLSVLELFELTKGIGTKTSAAMAAHEGLWLKVEGVVSDVRVIDTNWTCVTLNYKTKAFLDMPKLVNLYLFGEDGKVAKSFDEKTFIRGQGRIHGRFNWLTGIDLAPGLLTDYERRA